jgi:uncharacterized protein YcfL
MKKTFLFILVITGLISCAQAPSIEPPWKSNVSYSGKRLDVVDIQSWNIENLGVKVMLLVDIKNNTPDFKKFRHRVLWYTLDGVPVETTLSRWQMASEKRGTRKEYVYMAPSMDALRYKIELEDL